MKTLKLHPLDHVAVVTEGDPSFVGHKIALSDLKKGEALIKYGSPIGVLKQDVKKGERVHTENLKTALTPEFDPVYPGPGTPLPQLKAGTFSGYVREDYKVGIRNDLFIIPTVGCVNDFARKIGDLARKRFIPDGRGTLFGSAFTAVSALSHPYGCSQLGGDLAATASYIAGLSANPNAAGVLIISLGCENLDLKALYARIPDAKKPRVRTLVLQDCPSEEAEALRLLSELHEIAKRDQRREVSLDKLKIAVKCGGSDGFSGITANPLLGRISDRLTRMGGTVLFAEIPECFGAEESLIRRSKDETVFREMKALIRQYRHWYEKNGLPVSENPSPGNLLGGITTLEEKSLGCVQKNGHNLITAVVDPAVSVVGEPARPEPLPGGVVMVASPGNDLVSSTALAAAGAVLILFTTGRGTPFGSVVPTMKISTNTALYGKKPDWIDFDAGVLLNGKSFEEAEDALFTEILSVANGEKQCRNEINACADIAILKDGVTL